MLLNEIYNLVVERISTTAIGDQAYDALIKELPEQLNGYLRGFGEELPFTQIHPDKTERIDSVPGIARVTNYLAQEAAKILTRIAQSSNPGKLNNYGSRNRIFVKFEAITDSHDGEYSSENHLIKIHGNFIKQLGKIVYQYMEQSFIDNDFQIVRNVFDGYEDFWERLLHKICDIFVHELTHGEQFGRAAEKLRYDANYTYSSYKVDKKKFWELMSQELRTVERQEAYYSSPQEIDAFAQQFVYQQLQILKGETDENKVLYIDDMLKYFDDYIKSSRYAQFKDSGDPAVQKARRRFIKKAYQEFDHRRDMFKNAPKSIE